MLLYVNTYIGFCCGGPQVSVLLISWILMVCQIGRRKRVAPATPFLWLLFCWFLCLRSGFDDEVVNITPLIHLLVQEFNVLQVYTERHHFLTPCALLRIHSSFLFLGLLLLLLFHSGMHLFVSCATSKGLLIEY